MSECNKFYGRLNQQFDERAAFLIKHGYKLQRNDELGIGYFIKGNPGYKPHTITNAEILYSEQYHWEYTVVPSVLSRISKI